MEIHFKNGKTKIISQEIADVLKENIIKGCADLQMFSDINDNNKVILIIKLSEIVFID
jgi:hypothetical protein